MELTRKKLKTDKFAVEVEHSLEFVAGHKRQVGLYTGIGVAVAIAAAAGWYYRSQQHAVRQQALSDAITIHDTLPGPNTPYATEEAKRAESVKKFQAVTAQHSGSDEAVVAAAYLGSIALDQGKLADAERYFKQVTDEGGKEYGSIGKLSLAQIYFSTGKAAEGEKLFRSLMDAPTTMVSKEAATIGLARALAPTKPAEARKLLEPLKGQREAISQIVLSALGELPQQ